MEKKLITTDSFRYFSHFLFIYFYFFHIWQFLFFLPLLDIGQVVKINYGNESFYDVFFIFHSLNRTREASFTYDDLFRSVAAMPELICVTIFKVFSPIDRS